MNPTPPHLGGHGNVTHVDEGALRFFAGLGCMKMIDLGCGPGGQTEKARELGYSCVSIDGDPSVNPNVLHDFTKGPVREEWENPDLVWCVEFVEHVEERYIPNFLPVMTSGRVLCMTYSPKGHGGHHHVNERCEEYWKGVLAAAGMQFESRMTELVRERSTMKRDFIRQTGMVFAKA